MIFVFVGILPFTVAEIVTASFDQRRADRPAETLIQLGNILFHDLILQMDRMSADDHRLMTVQTFQYGGHEIGDGFACPRTRFGQKIFLAVKSVANSQRHRRLRRTATIT